VTSPAHSASRTQQSPSGRPAPCRSTWPRDFKHTKDGKTARLRFRQFRRATVPVYGSANGETQQKLLLEGELAETGESVTYWVDSLKVQCDLKQEFARRLKLGKADFEPGELITITQSDAQRPSRSTGNLMWDYDVEFEFGAPPPTTAELLLGKDGDQEAEIPAATEIPAAEADGDDSIPF
jgi:hypothetical protein